EVGWAGVASPDAALALFGLAAELAGASLTGFELIGRTPLGFSLALTPDARAPLSGDHPWHVLIDVSSGRSQEDASNLLEMILSEGLERGLIEDAAIAASIAQGNA